MTFPVEVARPWVVKESSSSRMTEFSSVRFLAFRHCTLTLITSLLIHRLDRAGICKESRPSRPAEETSPRCCRSRRDPSAFSTALASRRLTLLFVFLFPVSSPTP